MNRIIVFHGIFFTAIWALVVVCCVTLCPTVALSVGDAPSPVAESWKTAGGHLLLSHRHKFTQTWISDHYSRLRGEYWKGGEKNYYTPEEERQYASWDGVVKDSVSVRLGSFTVQGPGHIVVYHLKDYRNVGPAKVRLVYLNSGRRLNTQVREAIIQKDGSRLGVVPDEPFHPHAPRISEGDSVSFDVWADMVEYNNVMNTGEFSFYAPQETACEVWFFPEGHDPFSTLCREKLEKMLAQYLRIKDMTMESIRQYRKKIEVLNRPDLLNTGYLNEYQGNVLGNDPQWTAEESKILDSGWSGAEYLYNKGKWIEQLEKSIRLQEKNLAKIEADIAAVREKLRDAAPCKEGGK
ncbi:MAG: hypothetical protein EOM25_02095 [Deltaproteobacteria bacterium]|nr:hypothetical protein [Deltaproteobacteria bacterium]